MGNESRLQDYRRRPHPTAARPKPYVYTYFKNAPINPAELNKEDLDSLLQFKQKLQALGHFPTEYKTIDDLKAQFKGQLDKLIVRLRREVPHAKPETL